MLLILTCLTIAVVGWLTLNAVYLSNKDIWVNMGREEFRALMSLSEREQAKVFAARRWVWSNKPWRGLEAR